MNPRHQTSMKSSPPTPFGHNVRMKINLLEAVFVLFIQGDLRKWNQPSAMPPWSKRWPSFYC